MSFDDYIAHGWQLCAIPSGTKGPRYDGWNTRGAHEDWLKTHPNAGLLHALSGTCSIDVDNLAEARPYLVAHGVDIDALLAARDSVQIVSGRKNRAKLIYRLAAPLPSKKLAPYTNPIDEKQYHALELRCGTRGGASVQDVLPPSIHPDTQKPYEWRYGDEMLGSWRNLPELPAALLSLWQAGAAPREDLLGAPPTGEPEELTGAFLKELRRLLEYHDADAPYDDWLHVGMALHDATGGAPEGLVLYDEWSRRSKKYGEAKGGLPPQYPSDKWPGFTVGSGYTIDYLRSKAPVSLEAFPVVAEEFQPAALPPGQLYSDDDTRPAATVWRALRHFAIVKSQEKLLDTKLWKYLAKTSVDDQYKIAMPLMPSTNSSGHVTHKKPRPTDLLYEASWIERVDSVGMHPGAGRIFMEGGRSFLNTYEPPNIQPLVPTAWELEAFNFMWSRPDEEVFRDWLMKFYAHAVQKPGTKIRMAPLLVGHKTGSGKSTLMKRLPELLFTKRYVTMMTSQALQEQFNDQLVNAWWVHFEELHSGSSKGDRASLFNKIKPWITEDTLSIRPIYAARYDTPNRVQITGASNYEDDALLVDDQDRRWAIGHIDEEMSGAESADLYKFLDSERAPGVLHHIFRNASIADFNPNGRAPETVAKRVMVKVNYGHWESELLEMIAKGAPPFDKDVFEVGDILPYVKQGGITAQRLGRIVTRAPFNFTKMEAAYGKRLWCWRNADIWKEIGVGACNDYYLGNAPRPHGWSWSDELPPALAEACGL